VKRWIAAGIVLLATQAAAQEITDLDALLGQFGWDLANVEIETQRVADGLYVLFGTGGNIAVSIGEDGVLIVDDQFPELIPKVNAAIEKLGGGSIDFAINTHWHFDHAQGNLALGPAGTHLVAHSHSGEMMRTGGPVNLVVARYRQAPYPEDALPTITFDGRMQLHYNGGRIDLVHAGPAHTAGDTAVIFRAHNAVHLGDVFNNTGFPFIDADSGGDIDGMIAFCETVAAELEPGAIVIPGHGAVTDAAALDAYVAMLRTVRDRVSAMIAEGKSKEEVIAANPAADFEEAYGKVSESLGFLDRTYTSLAKKR
jgi:glyoxylase-like metal-dependent hydrolase (beta-lactamase superfamily II)